MDLYPSECDQADDSPYPRPEKERLNLTQEVESATTSKKLKMAKLEICQPPADGDLVALDIYFEELLQVLARGNELEFSLEELDFDVDEVLTDIHTFLGTKHSAVVHD